MWSNVVTNDLVLSLLNIINENLWLDPYYQFITNILVPEMQSVVTI